MREARRDVEAAGPGARLQAAAQRGRRRARGVVAEHRRQRLHRPLSGGHEVFAAITGKVDLLPTA